VIYGLAAALGWGVADFGAAVAGRKIGSLATVISGQGLNAVAMTVILLATGTSVAPLAPIVGWMALNGVIAAIAYATHYRALELGPIAVVSPIGAAYAVVGVALAVALLGERPGIVALAGAAVTVLGVMLASADLGKLRGAASSRAPGLPWALVAAVMFGIAAFILGWAAQEVGWVLGLWASRVAQVIAYLPLALARREELRPVIANPGRGVAIALAVGLADLLGVVTYSAGAAAGFISIVLVASAIFPLIAVALSVAILGERPVPNQYAGAGVVVAGLLLLGAG
jgi:uncharacterized membrane protein